MVAQMWSGSSGRVAFLLADPRRLELCEHRREPRPGLLLLAFVLQLFLRSLPRQVTSLSAFCNVSWLFPQCGNYSNPACHTELILAAIRTHMKSL